MFVESKETSFEQLENCIKTMNKESYWENPIKGYGKDLLGNMVTKEEANKTVTNRKGYDVRRRILAKYKITTLYELTKQQMDDIILLLHRSVI